MVNSIFKIVYLIELIAITAVRGRHTAPYRRLKTAVDRSSALDTGLLALVGVGMLVPLVYVFSSILDFADYDLPRWVGWLGALLFAGAAWLLWRSHADLGRNWTPTLGLREEHALVSDGVFRHIRHPMYAAHLLWGLAQLLRLHNWIAGPAMLLVTVPQVLLRVGDEERMMVERFGEAYERYMARTGRLLPRLRL